MTTYTVYRVYHSDFFGELKDAFASFTTIEEAEAELAYQQSVRPRFSFIIESKE